MNFDIRLLYVTFGIPVCFVRPSPIAEVIGFAQQNELMQGFWFRAVGRHPVLIEQYVTTDSVVAVDQKEHFTSFWVPGWIDATVSKVCVARPNAKMNRECGEVKEVRPSGRRRTGWKCEGRYAWKGWSVVHPAVFQITFVFDTNYEGINMLIRLQIQEYPVNCW